MIIQRHYRPARGLDLPPGGFAGPAARRSGSGGRGRRVMPAYGGRPVLRFLRFLRLSAAFCEF